MQSQHTFRDYAIATRPWSFPASAMPVIATLAFCAAAGHAVRWPLGIAALITIIVVHAAGNVWSDYFDYKHGVDATDTFGSLTLTSGRFTPAEVLRLAIVLQVAAVLLGLVMVWLTGWPLLAFGITGIALSLLYPPLKYNALGDTTILICYAILPTLGTTYVATGAVQWPVLWVALPIGLITMAILHANNTRDIVTDRRAGIRTFASLAGRRADQVLYCAEVLLPYLWVVLCAAIGTLPWWTLIVWLSLPLAWRNAVIMATQCDRQTTTYTRLDEFTAQLQMAFSLLLVTAFALTALL